MDTTVPTRCSGTMQGNDSAVLNIWLIRTRDGSGLSDWKVDRVVLTARDIINTVSLKTHRAIDGFLKPEFAKALMTYLPVKETDHVMTASDFLFETKGLALSCLRVTGHKIVDGVQRVMITLRRVVGGISNLFVAGNELCLLKEARTGISARLLEDIVSPVLNLVEFAPHRHSETAEERIVKCLDRLERNKYDLEFYAALITRFVHQMDEETKAAQHVNAKRRFDRDELERNDPSLSPIQ